MNANHRNLATARPSPPPARHPSPPVEHSLASGFANRIARRFHPIALACALGLLGLGTDRVEAADYSVGFEGSGETKTGYAAGSVTLSGISWNMTDALVGTEANDFKNGARSARLRGYATSSMTMLADKSGGAGTISFVYRRYGTDAQQPWAVEYSTTGGSSWTQVGGDFTAPASNDMQTFSENVSLTGNVRFRIICKATGTSNRRMNVDDILITDYAGVDETAPEVSSRIPAIAATGVIPDTTLSLTFDESIQKGTGTVSVLLDADDSTVYSVDVTTAAVSVAGSTATITLPGALASSTAYYVNVSPGAFEDLAGNDFPGISGDTAWTFTTGVPDETGPVVATYVPAVASSTSHPQANLTLTFDEPLTALSGNIEIFKSDDSPVATLAIGSPQVIISGTTLTINPTAPLEFATGYYVNLPAGAVEDAAGNDNLAITGSAGWSFTTRTAPAVVISQTYEGTTTANHFIELQNLTSGTVDLSNYRLSVWSDTAPSDNEGWKSGTGTTTRVISLAGESIPPNGFFLVSHSASNTPAYAAANNDIRDSGFDVVTFFDGDDSVVLYDGATNALDNIADAVSVSANNAVDTSLYRVSTEPIGYDFDPGTSVFDYGTVWTTRTLTDVESATLGDAWYLRASQDPTTLSLEFDVASVIEGAGPNAATATITRTGDLTEELFFNISVSIASEISVTTPASIPADSATATFPLTALDDVLPDGNRLVTITVQADGYVPGSAQITVVDDGLDPAVNVVINEVDSDQPGTDTNEFIELYNNSAFAQSLDGIVLVLYNGSGDTSYNVIDLSGHSIPANDYFVIGSSTVPNVDLEAFASGNGIQNGADAVILCFGAAADFPSGSAMVSGSLVLDALVYGTGELDDDGLIAGLNPGQPQANEGSGTTGEANSASRVPDGGAAFASSLFVSQLPTPGTTNGTGATDFETWALATGATGGMTGDGDFDGLDNAFEYAFGLNPTSGGSVDPFVVPFNPATGLFTYTRRKQSLTGLAYTYQYSTALSTPWTTFTPAVPPVTNNGDPVEQITVTVPAALLAEPKLFIRVVTP